MTTRTADQAPTDKMNSEELPQASTAPPIEPRDDGASPPIPSQQSAVLDVLADDGRPLPATVCCRCPHAMWRTTDQHLICYCRIMYTETHDTERPAPILITSCDGPGIDE